MSTDFMDVLTKQLVPILGQKAVDAAADELKELAGESDGWKKTLLALTANAVEEFGPEGIQKAMDVVEALRKNEVPKIDWADLEVASDILAKLQNAEADQKTAARDFMVKLSKVLGIFLVGIIQAL